jgi:uncharacterized repeat protein (TIGR03803 family)
VDYAGIQLEGDAMRALGLRTFCIGILFCVASVVASSAQTFTSLASFDGGPDGAQPWYLTVTQGADGNFYGETLFGGNDTSSCSAGCGTVFKVTPSGTLTGIYSFCTLANCADGSRPSGLILGTDGNFYGATGDGGAHSSGTVFKITPAGTLTTLYNFCSQTDCTDGAGGNGLVQGSDGNFYGTTSGGGANNHGTLFKITPAGKLTTLYNFCSQTNCDDGFEPAAGLTQGSDGNLYGTTGFGGAHNGGTIYKITPEGQFTTLYAFCSQKDCSDGENSVAGLVQATNGNFYGTTQVGGIKTSCRPYGCGTIFELTPSGQFTTLYSFCSETACIDGTRPTSGLTLGNDGNLYGVTPGGGERGVIFEITPAGDYSVLHHFCREAGCTDGVSPLAGVIQSTNGLFYGTTNYGGNSSSCTSCGTVYGLSTGLSPFVSALPAAGKAGRVVGIVGNNLTGATSVTFNGTPATFTVVSGTVIKATVPAGATTGTIQVTTPSGTLNSNVAFVVLP